MLDDKPIRLIIVDDHDIIRQGLISLLQEVPDLAMVGQARNGREAIALIRHSQPDIVLLDITMADMDGFEALKQFGPEFPGVKVVFLTIHEDKTFFFRALQAGAYGYFLKGSHSEELVNAIRAVHAGELYLPPKLIGGLVQEWLNKSSQLDPLLTPQEREILPHIGLGLTNRQLAEKLKVDPGTVKVHRRNIYRKLNLHDRASLVDYALRRGFLQAPPDDSPASGG